jgi:hypothetical protein
MKQKITVVGDGLAGMMAINLLNHKSNLEVVCYTNNSPAQNVGISATLDFYLYMKYINNIDYSEISKFKAHHKTGVSKENFNVDYFQSFDLANISCHFNSLDVINYLKSINTNIKYVDKIDSDYTLITTGKPELNDKNYTKIENIPVDRALGIKIRWKYPNFEHTRIIARPYGWISLMPTKEFMFVTYMYNNIINTHFDILKDLKEFLETEKMEHDLENYQIITFDNYYRKSTFENKTFYSGNAAFFIEPFEATSLSGTLRLNAYALDYLEKLELNYPHYQFNEYITECIETVLMHYLSGSIYDTEFWQIAEKKATKYFSENTSSYFKERLLELEYPYKISSRPSYFYDINVFRKNIENLGILSKLKNII